MADRNEKGASSPWMAFLLGAIVVVVAMVGYLIYAGQGYEALHTAGLNAGPPSFEQPSIPDIPINIPEGRGS